VTPLVASQQALFTSGNPHALLMRKLFWNALCFFLLNALFQNAPGHSHIGTGKTVEEIQDHVADRRHAKKSANDSRSTRTF
jgi:hypothetical protein